MNYIDRLLENKYSETTFTDNNDGKTVTIQRKGDPSTSVLAAELDLTVETPENEKVFAVEDFIRRNYNGNFRLDKAIELIQNIDKTNTNNITFKPLTSRNECGNPQIVLKRDAKGVLKYNKAKTAKESVKQLKKLINEIQEEQKDRDETVENMPIIEREPSQEQIDEIDRMDGLTEKEKKRIKRCNKSIRNHR